MDLIIPVFNRLEYTQTCLSSLLDVDHGVELDPIVVDNGSRRKTRKFLEEWLAKAEESPNLGHPKILTHAHNLGFAAAVNTAISHHPQDKFVLVMHNDCVPFPGWAKEMTDCLKDHEDDDVIAVMPRTSYANEEAFCVPDVRERFEGLKFPNKNMVTMEDVSSLLTELYEDKQAVLDDLRKLPRTAYTPEIACYCMAVVKECLVETPLDEEFWPRFCEDKFWFLQYERQGCLCMVSNWSYVHHFGNITSDGPGFTMPDLLAANEAKFKEKVRVLNELSVPKKETDPDVAVHNDMQGATLPREEGSSEPPRPAQ